MSESKREIKFGATAEKGDVSARLALGSRSTSEIEKPIQRNVDSPHQHRRWLFTLLVIIALVSATHSHESKGVVVGTIYDASGEAVMPGTEVAVKGNYGSQKAVSDQSGSYKFRLPPGNYEITAFGNSLYPLQRSSFKVISGQSITVNLYPSFRLRTQALVITNRGTADEYSYWPKSEYELIPAPNGNNCLIEYRKRKIYRGSKEYTSTGFEKVKLTRGLLTVLAAQIRIDSLGKIRASGQVLIDDGGKRAWTDEYIVPVY